LSVFSHWSYSDLEALLLQLETEKFFRNQKVFSEGEVSEKVYFIWSGEIELKKDIFLKNAVQAEDKDPFFKDVKLLSNPVKLKDTSKRELCVAILGEKDYFGEIGVIEKQPYPYSALVKSKEAIFLTITRDKFFRYIRDPKSRKAFLNNEKSRKEWRTNMTNNFTEVYTNLD